MSRECGTCTLCCKLLGVEELNKPVGVWCSHCRKGEGCGIYPTRPEVCRIFECLWLQGILPEKLTPQRTHCVFALAEDGKVCTVNADPDYGQPWETPEVQLAIDALVNCGITVVVACGNRRKLITNDQAMMGKVVELVERGKKNQ